MDEHVIMEVANEIKTLHMSASEFIQKNDYENAAIQYRKALNITEKSKYFEGSAKTLLNMSNLSAMVGDVLEALNNAADANDMFRKAGKVSSECKSILEDMTQRCIQKGIENEKEGNLKEAILHYKTSIPFSNDSDKRAMTHEIKVLRGIMKKRPSTDK
jgi:tetratricopeptide (TPR) repeat protein